MASVFAILIFFTLLAYEVNCFPQNYSHSIFYVDPDTDRNVSELISSKGYPVENYEVQTEDGFILSVQHIPHGRKKGNKAKLKNVVFLQHGLLSSATDFVINFPNESLGFLLADAGYDVWLGNTRGNTYSRKHIKLTPDMAAFWNYSFDEMAKFDLPAMIDFVLNKTSSQQLFYIGHSQGTTAAFALLSERPDFNQKIRLMVALAPVATVGHILSPIRYLAPFSNEEEFLFELFGVNEFLPSNRLMKYFSEFVCDSAIQVICEDIVFLICGSDMSQLNQTRLHVYISHTPAGSSTKSIIHFGQLVESKRFQKYDYGKERNMAMYNQESPHFLKMCTEVSRIMGHLDVILMGETAPPQYYVENITTPVALFWSRNDMLADPADVGILENRLRSMIASTSIKDPLFNHLDFVWGIDAAKYVYSDVISLLKKYSVNKFYGA